MMRLRLSAQQSALSAFNTVFAGAGTLKPVGSILRQTLDDWHPLATFTSSLVITARFFLGLAAGFGLLSTLEPNPFAAWTRKAALQEIVG